MNRHLLQASFAALMFLSTAAYAHGDDVRQDQREVRQDRRETRDDRRDRARVAALLERYDAALRFRNDGALRALDREALQLMDAELREGRREVRRDRAEVARSAHEVRDGRYERGHADDHRDLRDDVRDLRAERADLHRVRAIREDFARLSGRTNRWSVHQKRSLLAEFLQRAYAEVREDWRQARR